MSFKILVADDEPDNRTILVDALEAAGYAVLCASNGVEALESATREPPDLILLDMSMPKMDGWEAARRLRQMPQTARIPLIAFTAHALVGEDAKAKAAGCDDYLSKPCRPREVVERVASWLERRKA